MGSKRIDFLMVILTVVGTLASIGALAAAIRTPCLVCLGLSAVCFGAYALLKKRQPLPSIESLRPELFTIERASVEDIRWIAELEARAYSRGDAVPEHVLRDWYTANPNGFFVLKLDGTPIGHIDFLAIKDPVFQLFREGKLREVDIPRTELYTPEEKEYVRSIYVESVIIDPPAEYEDYSKDASALKYMLSQFLPMAKAIAVPSKLGCVYAIAATEAGKRLLGLLGFQIARGRKEREDHHDLFRAEFAELVVRICRIVGNRISSTHRAEIDAIVRQAAGEGL